MATLHVRRHAKMSPLWSNVTLGLWPRDVALQAGHHLYNGPRGMSTNLRTEINELPSIGSTEWGMSSDITTEIKQINLKFSNVTNHCDLEKKGVTKN